MFLFISTFICTWCLQVQSELGVDDIILDFLAEKYFNYIDVR